MTARAKLIFFIFLAFSLKLEAQQNMKISFTKDQQQVLPGKVFNLAFFIENNTKEAIDAKLKVDLPADWKIVIRLEKFKIHKDQKKFQIVSVQVPASYPVGKFVVGLQINSSVSNTKLASDSVLVEVMEVEKILLQDIEHPSYVFAGDEIKATYLIQNHGNTTKNLFIETKNCQVEGGTEVRLDVGESKILSVIKPTFENQIKSSREIYSVRVMAANRVLGTVINWTQVFPSKKYKKDLHFRFPISASGSYLAVNKDNNLESTYQFHIHGQGTLDVAGKHQLEFLARGPNNTDLSYLGMHDQYYVSYKNENLHLFGGQKNFVFTPLTESSRYGLGVESRLVLNNGLTMGFIYLEPQFYKEIKNEMGGLLGFHFNKNNRVEAYFISKQMSGLSDNSRLFSVTSQFTPFAGTNVDMELSRGYYNGKADNAYRINTNSRISIFNLSGTYYNTGKYYPGYYNNTKFYSGNISARLTQKLGLSFFAKRDFINAQLDTFFVTAPITESFQSSIDYKIGKQSHLKFFWRQYERQDRLSLNKFHYKTQSANLRFSQKWQNFRYSFTGEAGRTTNYLFAPGENKQNSYRGTGDISYRFKSKHSVRVFGTWSNINEFISGKHQNVTAGLSLSSQFSKNIITSFYVQNAYDIDDYYKNRNLMQLNLNYNFLKNHSISLKSFYTIFKTELEDAELTVSATYSYKFGVPLKQIIKAGTVSGTVTRFDGTPAAGIWVRLLNKTTVTDKEGQYKFDLIQPGEHLLYFDESSFKLDEITNIPNPVEVNVFEDQKTAVDVRILKGGILKGKIKLGTAKLKAVVEEGASPANIIIEVKSAFEQYRITTGENGDFTFPLLKPGKVQLKIYSGTIPKGYKLTQTEYEYILTAGEENNIEITLQPQNDNIIFKPVGNKMLKQGLGLNAKSKPKTKEKQPLTNKPYYSIQIGAFSRKLNPGDAFFKGEQFYSEKQINNLHKYYIGHFSDLKTAKKALRRLKSKFKKLFIVVIDNNKVYSVHQHETMRK